jgi:hypothetical protein
MRRAAQLMRLGWRAYWRWRYREMTRRLLHEVSEDWGPTAKGFLALGSGEIGIRDLRTRAGDQKRDWRKMLHLRAPMVAG